MIFPWETSASDRCCGVSRPDGENIKPLRRSQEEEMTQYELCGLTLIIVGIWVSVNGSSFLQLVGSYSSQGMQFINVGVFCIAIGALLLVLGLLGFCGAYKENKCLLLMFFSIILIIFIAEVAAAVVALVFSSFAERLLGGWATPALKKSYGADPVLTKMWNSTMTQLNCCGFNNYTDFVGSEFEKETGGSLPPVCCGTNSTICSKDKAALSGVQGCFKLVLKSLKEQSNIVASVAAGIGLLEIASMILSMYLFCQLGNTIN
ncbi:hypothetical protein Q5P01_015530 [Channa striata]|uniref:Tetraspanin n=1 Tax=Channa striata TaxID=64152 RepID=A0AA88SFB6_CHASR|nr:hypothetical protein Q5P01_015530 [Channa striata]